MEILYLLGFAVVDFLFLRYVLPILLQAWDAMRAIIVLVVVGVIVVSCIMAMFQN